MELLKTLSKKLGLWRTSNKLLQHYTDIEFPPLKYDEYADSEFLVYFSDVTDDECWKHRLPLKFGPEQLNVLNGTFRQHL